MIGDTPTLRVLLALTVEDCGVMWSVLEGKGVKEFDGPINDEAVKDVPGDTFTALG